MHIDRLERVATKSSFHQLQERLVVGAVHPSPCIVGDVTTLADIYLADRPDAAGVDGLESRLVAAVDVATGHFRDFDVDGPALTAALAGLPKPIDALSNDAVIELALGLACGRGDAAALRALERDYFPVVKAALVRMGLAPDVRDEVTQEVRRKLLVAPEDGTPPRIVGYAGRGSLRGLLKVTATRTAISMSRRMGREGPGDDAVLDGSGERDPELSFLKARYRGVFKEAFAEAVAALDVRERNLMRLHFLRKVTLDALAEMYGVHRATIVRHIARVRENLDSETRRALRERLEADPVEVESVMGLIASRFEVSVERLLRTEEQ